MTHGSVNIIFQMTTGDRTKSMMNYCLSQMIRRRETKHGFDKTARLVTLFSPLTQELRVCSDTMFV